MQMTQQIAIYAQNSSLIVGNILLWFGGYLTKRLFRMQVSLIYRLERAWADSPKADLAVLNNCRRASGSEFRHGNRNSCFKGTREAALDEIELWTKDFT